MKNIISTLFILGSIVISNELFSQNNTLESKSCGSCGKQVSIYSRIGMTCPHCGVKWGYENEMRNKKTNRKAGAFHFTIEERLEAQKSLRGYLNFLGSNCNEAFSYIRNKNWLSKGINWFCSKDAYGSMINVYNITTKYVNSTDSFIKIKATYSATDKINGNGNYIEIYSLNKSEGKWYIYKVDRVGY